MPNLTIVLYDVFLSNLFFFLVGYCTHTQKVSSQLSILIPSNLFLRRLYVEYDIYVVYDYYPVIR